MKGILIKSSRNQHTNFIPQHSITNIEMRTLRNNVVGIKVCFSDLELRLSDCSDEGMEKHISWWKGIYNQLISRSHEEITTLELPETIDVSVFKRNFTWS